MKVADWRNATCYSRPGEDPNLGNDRNRGLESVGVNPTFHNRVSVILFSIKMRISCSNLTNALKKVFIIYR